MASRSSRAAERYRQDQLAIQRAFLADYLDLWSLLNPQNLAGTASGWLASALRLVGTYRQRSAEAAEQTYRELRALEVEAAEPLPPVEYQTRANVVVLDERRAHRGNRGIDDSPRRGVWIDWGDADKAAAASLTVTGPVNIKARSAKGQGIRLVERQALVESAGAAARHVLNGGRRVNADLVQADPVALGWVRVTAENPCSFCAMLASRGPVFKKSSFNRSDPRWFGPGDVKVHDHCACTMQPVFSRSAEWPGRARELQEMWQANIAGRYSGKDALRAWRRLYEDRNPPASAGGFQEDAVAQRAQEMAERRIREVTAQIAALEPTFASLARRRAAGENVTVAWTYQRDLLAKLRAELAVLRRSAA